jgi:hypothetical protein
MVALDIEKKKKDVLKAWQNYFLSRYTVKPPIEISSYIEDCTSQILDKLIEFYNGGSFKGVEEPLDELMRYLATDRNLSPGGSIASIFYLKKIFLEKYPKMSLEDFIKLNEAIDLLICKAFDAYMKSREKLFELRYKEKEFQLRMEMKAYEFCMKRCPYIRKARELGIDPWDLPMEEIDKLLAEKRSDKH